MNPVIMFVRSVLLGNLCDDDENVLNQIDRQAPDRQINR